MSEPTSKPSFLRRAVRRVVVITLTSATLVAAGAVVTIGTQELQARADLAKPTTVADLIPVRVQPIRYEEGYTIPRRYVGELETAQSTDIAFEFSGLVADVLVDEGDRVARGDIIARLDTALLETEIARLDASRDALNAQLAFADLSVQRRQALQERGFTSTEAYDQARFNSAELTARIAETSAAIRNTEIQIEKATLYAPFDGQIAARQADQGSTVSPGQTIATLLETSRPRVRVGLPLSVQLDPGADVEVKIAGQAYQATLLSMRPDVDSQTRTQTALFDLPESVMAQVGQTVSVSFDRHIDAMGAWVPVEALREGAKGLWTVMMLDDSDVLRPAAVEVLHAEAERAYVRGSFQEGAALVERGAHRLTPGQTVRRIGGE
ncbi:efflux RND transporter periplasmic adaptor subunit [Thalassococcus sp. S3]|uniref:efflux RND transporter periplasmic adaptor subunit n=1 Tax=Thalassococcus sp. S3 TaxID=2017482 RepID=UPI0010247ED7|nr:efflux RND transporter periplasmic adaptor subunit [Thalassococcus sp. S3]QBF32302.1 efflux transporter periplasmic adaptor subunit [Thalassococcus sp. S3]